MGGGWGRVLLGVGLVAGGWYFVNHYQVAGLDRVRVVPRASAPQADAPGDAAPAAESSLTPLSLASRREPLPDEGLPGEPATAVPRPLRIATFDLSPWGSLKAEKPAVVERIASLLCQFDAIAVQGIEATPSDLLPQLVQQINRSGASYDAAAGPPVGRGAAKVRMGFIFDARRLEIDRRQLYTLSDPSDQLAREPLVGWFRTRGVPLDRAWTFTLVCLDFQSPAEIDLLPTIYRAIAGDRRHEDDLLLAGGFGTDASALVAKLGPYRVEPAITSTPTDLYRTAQYDNLLIGPHATAETTGRSGATDFLRLFNLAMAEAEEMAGHLPVWAEFQPTEAGPDGT